MTKTRITVLIENSCSNNQCVSEHGLSIYVETANHHLLIDAGASENFIANAHTMNIDLSTVDTLVLSHGHYDHGGGIPFFHNINKNTNLYIQKAAFDKHFGALGNNIGINNEIMNYPNTKLIQGNYKIDDELFIFSDVKGRRLYPAGNLKMSVIKNGEKVQDQFDHEQYLVLTTDKGNILFSGCAHNGILNIIDKYHELYNNYPYAVMSGFHMMKNVHAFEPFDDNDINTIIETATELSKIPTLFFTGHCTGDPAFEIMKPILKDKLHKLSTGFTFTI